MNSKIPVIYIIGPFRAENSWLIEQNVRRAEEEALELWKLGFAVICPHTNTRFFNGAADDSIWLEGDKEILKRCDAALCMENWSDSIGSRQEVLYCKELKKLCFSSIEDLLVWYGKESGLEPKMVYE